LAPAPNRGQANRPAWVPLVGAAVADIRGEAAGKVEALTWENASNCLQLRASPTPA
jgi:Tat protein secretion system quality control protein TatD with DNase activity